MSKKPESNETIRFLDEIARFKPGKSAQIAAKNISEKYKDITRANAMTKKEKGNRTFRELKDDDFIPLKKKKK